MWFQAVPTLKQGRTNQENVSNTGCAPGARDDFAFAVDILATSACSAEPAREKALLQITPLRGHRQTAFDQFPPLQDQVERHRQPAANQGQEGVTGRMGRRSVSKSKIAATQPHAGCSAAAAIPCSWLWSFNFRRVRNENENRNGIGPKKEKQDRQIHSRTFSSKPPCLPARLHTTPARLISLNHTLAMGEREDKQITTGI